MARQYLLIRFRPHDVRSYIYHHDGEPIAIGDHVEVDSRDGPFVVRVERVQSDAPTFQTKPITQVISKGVGR